jgi:hypothetical protein
MRLAVLAVLAHVEQRDLAAVVQPGFEGLRIDEGGRHGREGNR